MGSRKKSKPNPKASSSTSNRTTDDSTRGVSGIPNTLSQASESSFPAPASENQIADSNASQQGNSKQPARPAGSDERNGRRSWYGGSWRQKASPVAQIAKESISSTGGITSEMDSPGSGLGPKPPTNFLGKRRSSKGNPIAASMTKINVTSSNSNETRAEDELEFLNGTVDQQPDPPLPPDPTNKSVNCSVEPEEKATETVEQQQIKKATSAYSAWLGGWWSRPDPTDSDGGTAKDTGQIPEATIEDAKMTPLPAVTPGEEVTVDVVPSETPANAATDKIETKLEGTDKNMQSRSWFWNWSRAQNAKASQVDSAESSAAEAADNTEMTTVEASKPNDQPTEDPTAMNETEASQPTSSEPPPTPKSSGWAFWSREKPKSAKPQDHDSAHKQVGELAVADTPSQSHPEVAQFNEQEVPVPKDPSKELPAKAHRGRSKAKEKKVSSEMAAPVKTTPSVSPSQKAIAEASSSKQTSPNLLLPDFHSTYRLVQTPSYWQKIRSYLVASEQDTPHLHIAPNPPRIKKALSIGVHGYFPAPLIQKVLGQPTGTSIRFANAGADSIKSWTEARGYSCEIEQIALEGEGFIADRVNTLWKLLLNWIDHIKEADFILVSCHSQGVPVAICLVSKLIQFGCVSAAKIGVCAMAGVNLGPFQEYKPRLFGGSAAELFEFSKLYSPVTQMYHAALQVILKYGVRIVYVGSIDDQLVSLESSTFSNISHPYIYRAVFIDGRIHAPDFITHLVGFVFKLRNIGLPDHGLIRELSPALAGSLYSGEGHSRLYDDSACYSLAVSHALETTSLPSNDVPVAIRDYNGPGASGNPYFLPWAMRGLLEEDLVKRELRKEVNELLHLFGDWKPTNKGLKDVRFRLEAVKSKL